MGLLPSDPDVSAESTPRVVGLDSEDADALMSALTSETARRILAALHEEPATPSAVAESVDTSLQNAQYHLKRLEEAGAIRIAGTAYSEKGREMDVFAPADSPLVIVAGREEESTGIRDALRRLGGGVGALALGSLVVQAAFGGGLPVAQSGSGAGGADGGEPTGGLKSEEATGTPTTTEGGGAGGATPTPDGPGALDLGNATGTPAPEATGIPGTATAGGTATSTPAVETSTEAVTVAASGGDPGFVLGSLPPGLVFFLGGLLLLIVGLAITRARAGKY
jgi:DNA-binding transcriptional ArsR family regulator